MELKETRERIATLKARRDVVMSRRKQCIDKLKELGFSSKQEAQEWLTKSKEELSALHAELSQHVDQISEILEDCNV